MSFFASSRRGGAAAPRRQIAVAGLSLNGDLVRYREGYPGESLNNASLRANLRFYKNEIKSVPDGDFIDAMHDGWWRDYRKLEVHHGYVQWLFPIHEEGMNHRAQILQRHERDAMVASPVIIERVKRSYELILDFWGAKVVDWRTGELQRAENFKQCFSNLNARSHNYLRITRILKWLGEMDLEHLKLGFLVFFAREAILLKTIPNAAQSLENYWLGTLRQDAELASAVKFVRKRMSFEDALRLVQQPEERGYSLPSIDAALHLAPGQRMAAQPQREHDSDDDDAPVIGRAQRNEGRTLPPPQALDKKDGSKGNRAGGGDNDAVAAAVGTKRQVDGSPTSQQTLQENGGHCSESDDEWDPDSVVTHHGRAAEGLKSSSDGRGGAAGALQSGEGCGIRERETGKDDGDGIGKSGDDDAPPAKLKDQEHTPSPTGAEGGCKKTDQSNRAKLITAFFPRKNDKSA